MTTAPELLTFFGFLRKHRELRSRLAAPPDKTVVYSGGVETLDGFHAGWRLLALAKAKEPQRFDYVTLEERLRQFHAIELGESLFEHANRVGDALRSRGLEKQALILWRALSGIYVQGARGKVRALILPGSGIAGSVLALTEVKVLLREDVLHRIQFDPSRLREFRVSVQAGTSPAPIVVM